MVLITGAEGQLGSCLSSYMMQNKIEYKGAGRADFDLSDCSAIKSYVRTLKPQAIIHCGAYNDVDRAESDEEVCRLVNVGGTAALVEVCREIGAELMYISTDYVFDGCKKEPYETGDVKNPQSVYGVSKSLGEDAAVRSLERFYIVRISRLFGHGYKNFVESILAQSRKERIRVVEDQVGSPTYTEDLAPLLCAILMSRKYGVYHATNEGYCSCAEWAEHILSLSGKQTRVEKVTTEEYRSPARRPLNSRLSKSSLDRSGFSRLPPWQDAVKRYLESDGRIPNGQNGKTKN